jgi:putative ABC transport system permease protein
VQRQRLVADESIGTNVPTVMAGQQFVVEALVLSVAGGLIGLALGSAIPVAVTLFGLLEAPVTLSSALFAAGFSLAVGLFFGSYSARRPARPN